jgi:hypothetical protein
MISEESPSSAFNQVFNSVINVAPRDLPGGIEVYLIPAHVAYVALHTPIGHEEGYPIPLGILSFDPKVITQVHNGLSAMLTTSYAVTKHCDWPSKDVLAEIEAALVVPENKEPASGSD